MVLVYRSVKMEVDDHNIFVVVEYCSYCFYKGEREDGAGCPQQIC